MFARFGAKLGMSGVQMGPADYLQALQRNTALADSEPAPWSEEAIAFGRKFGLGCFSVVIGAFSGGMVAVLVGKIVAGLTKAPSCEGLPTCNWYVYAGVGALVGAVTLPTLVLRRLGAR